MKTEFMYFHKDTLHRKIKRGEIFHSDSRKYFVIRAGIENGIHILELKKLSKQWCKRQLQILRLSSKL